MTSHSRGRGGTLPEKWTCKACGRYVPHSPGPSPRTGDAWIGHRIGCPDRAGMLAPLPSTTVLYLNMTLHELYTPPGARTDPV